MDRIDYTYITDSVCNMKFDEILIYFLIPIIVILIFLLILKYKDFLLNLFYTKISKRGYIKILYRLPNMKIKEHFVKLDGYNNFTLGKGKNKRKYSLEKMYNFIFGYDKYNFPIFLYDYSFIFPLILTKTKINKKIVESLKEAGIRQEDIKTEDISAVSMKIDSSILHTVYDKKLLSDLYTISKSSEIRDKIMWVLVITGLLIVAYYTGILEKVLAFLGIDLNATIPK